MQLLAPLHATVCLFNGSTTEVAVANGQGRGDLKPNSFPLLRCDSLRRAKAAFNVQTCGMMLSMSDQSPFGDDLELRLVRRPEGSRRSKSTGTPGAERDLLRDSTGALLGPTESFPVDTDELRKAFARSEPMRRGTHSQGRSPGKQMAVDVATDVAYVAIREAVAQVYHLVIAPKAKAKWTELQQSRRPERRHAGSEALASELVVADFAQPEEPSTDLVTQPPSTVMDSVEFRQRLALMLAAENFAAEQRRLLAAARISDAADLPPELADAMKFVLEKDTSGLDDISLQLLVDFLLSNAPEFLDPVEADYGRLPELETRDIEE